MKKSNANSMIESRKREHTWQDFGTIIINLSGVAGVPLSKIPVTWSPFEPDNNGGVEDCVIMVQNGTIADIKCNETYPYICYKKKLDALVFSGCGTVDKGNCSNSMFKISMYIRLVWCPGQNKRIAPLSFLHGCRKR
jgi:hypothetical protein